MITCAANGCPSTQTTRIDGNPISFYPFPDDDLRKNQWLHNCNLASGIVNDNNKPLHLCELHFERNNFTASKDLKSNSVPTLFGRIEEPPRKLNKVEKVLEKEPAKQKKLDEHSHTLVTPPQSPFTQDNAEDTTSGNKANASADETVAVNGSATSSSVLQENLQTNTKTYRLIIQIDKIRGKPGPKCKKILPLLMLNNDTKATNEQEKSKLRPLFIKKPCVQGNCKLRRCVYNSRLAFQCELCNKYYITKKEEIKSYSCTICSKNFPNPQALYMHIRKHFTCDICETECNSQPSYDKHVRLHVSTDPLCPYKCHQCKKTFELKESVKQHCLEHPKIKVQKSLLQVSPPPITTIISPQNDYRCMNCNISFKSDQAYRNHLSSHGKKEGLSCNINETNKIIPVPNPLTGSQIGILQPVKFSCRVCSKEFDNVGEVDSHTRIHLDTEEGLKCNICKKFFKSNVAFSEHLKQHLARAHPCPICSKAFINKTTLKIHLKTHSDS
ncbi:Zinc finger protein 425 [Camponotus floridanus]|uniref:Zinc finger protein 425 n=1 Tax=Camponotus floridanus TaxID=104421 RepID=E2AUP9_CAMFO|nr:zinc finger protein Xfin [Camponotus floridanus]EFN62848.1 Zinc finger protein 425 [Camponotus floridanus]